MTTTAVNSIGEKINPDHKVGVEPANAHLRVEFGGEAIANSGRALVLHKDNYEPVYYFPQDDVRMNLLTPTDHSTHCPYKGDASYWTINAGGKELPNGAWGYLDPLEERPDIEGMVAFYQRDVDAVYVGGERWE